MTTARAGRVIRFFGASILIIATVLVTTPKLASAHNTVGSPGANFRAEILSFAPAIDDLTVKITDLGQHVEVTSSRHTVIVLGYGAEPYLRIDGTGLSENVLSPATFLNRDATVKGLAPADFDAAAAPVWENRSGTRTASWHDHRLHPMSSDVGNAHLEHEASFAWRLELLVDGQSVTIAGRTLLLDSPALLPSLLTAVGAGGLALVLLGRFPRSGTAALGLGTIAAVAAVSFARWDASTDTMSARVVSGIGPVVASVLLIAALYKAVRNGQYKAAPMLLLAFGATTITIGFGLIQWLFYAELPATGPASVWRLIVAVVVGAGCASVIMSVKWLRPSPKN